MLETKHATEKENAKNQNEVNSYLQEIDSKPVRKFQSLGHFTVIILIMVRNLCNINIIGLITTYFLLNSAYRVFLRTRSANSLCNCYSSYSQNHPFVLHNKFLFYYSLFKNVIKNRIINLIHLDLF